MHLVVDLSAWCFEAEEWAEPFAAMAAEGAFVEPGRGCLSLMVVD